MDMEKAALKAFLEKQIKSLEVTISKLSEDNRDDAIKYIRYTGKIAALKEVLTALELGLIKSNLI